MSGSLRGALNSRPARGLNSSRTINPAERLYLSPLAEVARNQLPASLRHDVNAALRLIKADPDWIPGVRHIAPAGSRHQGLMVDVSVTGVAIVYEVHAKDRAVEIIDISRILL
jgi:hypothetical protein